MKLSELHTGESGIIVKVTGHGGFRKRIVEMGFIKGQKVDVLLNAPLKDPVKYRVMGYEVSLRHSEADMIEVMTVSEYKQQKKTENQSIGSQDNTRPADRPTGQEIDSNDSDEQPLPRHSVSDEELKAAAEQKSRVINVALVGNPNCGKTSLFNFASGAHERVGNYSGVTVDAKEGHATFEGYQFNIVDLPGTYSLSAYSPEELYVRKQLVEKTPDVVINVIDTSNLERNLYLTTQVMDMHLRIVVALNMFDETEKRGDNMDLDRLSELFGMPMVPTVFKTGEGVKELFHKVIEIYESTEDKDSHYRHIHINHGHEIEHGIKDIQEHLKQEPHIRERYSTRFLAIKLLERDKEVEELVRKMPDAEEIFRHRDEAARRVKEETNVDSETAIMDAKYGFIHGALKEANYQVGDNNDTYRTSHVLDRILTNSIVGFPLFLGALAIMFLATFWLGAYPQDRLDQFFGWIGDLISKALPDGPVEAMLVDGVIGGVGSVASFLPQILILYLFISFMEDSGYMSRAAFIMDKIMHKMGLHGKSFIPLIMGFGCNVPAVMSTRTIESKRSRLVTMLILPLMSCEARIPIYIMIIGSFFTRTAAPFVMMSLYLVGMLMAVIMSRIFTKTLFKGEDTPFVMELPPYRFPTLKALGRHTWEKGKQYLKKMGGIILVASIIVWALSYFPHPDGLDNQQQQQQSYIARIGQTVEPVFRPQGFNWKLDVGLIAGVGAKEIVASTMGVLYSNDDSFSEDNSYNDEGGKYERLHQQLSADLAQLHHKPVAEIGPTATLTAYCFLLFVLLYFPCIATIAAIKGETGSWKWAAFTATYTTVLAWVVSAIVFQVGSLFI
ncbi:MAG: ferrous iron transport protein B [Prevotella sp.]|nr:ferrous iron transport protein B [Prevotella sp.]